MIIIAAMGIAMDNIILLIMVRPKLFRIGMLISKRKRMKTPESRNDQPFLVALIKKINVSAAEIKLTLLTSLILLTTMRDIGGLMPALIILSREKLIIMCAI